jgi:hypothetical protein
MEGGQTLLTKECGLSQAQKEFLGIYEITLGRNP